MPIKFIDIISPHYQNLIEYCEKRKISVNLDIQDLTIPISDEYKDDLEKFLQQEIKRAVKNCKSGDKITLSEANNESDIKISVKNSGAETLSFDEKEKIIKLGYEVRARFGYDTIVSLRLKR